MGNSGFILVLDNLDINTSNTKTHKSFNSGEFWSSNIDKKILMRRYQSIKLFMTYEEYLKYKQKSNSDL